MYGYFYKGNVRFISQGLFNAKYSVVRNGSIIKVKNSTHVRLLWNQYGNFPDKFEIIAPIDAIQIISGELPENEVNYQTINEYLRFRKMYIGV